jgi:ATP-dependent helicase/nuclease subunit B
MEYFFRYALGIEAPEEYAVSPEVWLEPQERGELLHDVFRDFMAWLCAKGMLPELERDAALLEEILVQKIAGWKKAKPPLNPDAFEREARELRLAARIFLTEEEAFCRGSRPVFLEASVGLPLEGMGSPLDSPDPVEITLPDGSVIRARGRIDRVDEVMLVDGPRAFDVWDYKTGSDWGFDQNDPLRGGRRLQHVLYLELAQARLDELYPGSAVRGCGYFFPGERVHGERYYWTATQLEAGREYLSLLCRMLAAGCFPFTDSPGDVGLSDYRPAFGNVEAAAGDAARKLANPDNLALLPFAALRGVMPG